jgi:hypothetical protein
MLYKQPTQTNSNFTPIVIDDNYSLQVKAEYEITARVFGTEKILF